MNNIFTSNYNLLYFSFAVIVLWLILTYYWSNRYNKIFNSFYIIVVSVLYILLLGSRDISVGTDTPRYINIMKKYSSFSELHFSQIKDIGIYGFAIMLKSIFHNNNSILYGMAFLYIVPISLSFILMKINHSIILFFCFISFFFFKSMGINILRQGVAVSLFLLAITLDSNQHKKYIPILLVIVAFLFHASIIIPVFIYFISKYINKISIPISIYLLAILLAFLSFNLQPVLEIIPIVNVLVEDRLQSYLTNSNIRIYKTGFRADFLIFNTFFALIGLYFYSKEHVRIHFPNYKLYINSYLITSAFFFLMFRIPFSDRFGIFSWVFIPFLLSPFLHKIEVENFGLLKIFVLSIVIFIAFNFGMF